MLYLINFIDYEDEKNQTPILLRTNLPEEKINETIEKIVDESKELWNEDENYWGCSLSEIVLEKLEEIFGKENIIEFTHLNFYW